MILPEDTTTTPPPSTAGNLVDTAPLITAEQRESDFNRLFTWRGREITFSIYSELYYRELRAHMNAPPLDAYQTMGDFSAEAPRVLYCAHFNAKQLRALRLLPAEKQVEIYDAWVEANIHFHELGAASKLAQEINAATLRARTQPMETGNGDIDGMGN